MSDSVQMFRYDSQKPVGTRGGQVYDDPLRSLPAPLADQLSVNIDRFGYLLFELFELESIVMLLEVLSIALFMFGVYPGFIAKGTQAVNQLVDINTAIDVTIWKMPNLVSIFVNFHKRKRRVRERPDGKIRPSLGMYLMIRV